MLWQTKSTAVISERKPERWKVLAAFAIIYFVWGSTFLAIRIGVLAIPPFLLAALRFAIAGALLLLWPLSRRETLPTPRQWASLALLALLIFVGDYGLLFTAEQRVPSGVASVLLSTIAAFTALAEIVILRTQRLTARLAFALLVGLSGVAVLVSHKLNLGSTPIDIHGALMLLTGAIFWSVASVLSRKLPLPASKPMSSALQMLLGGVMLFAFSAALGEPSHFHPHEVSRAAWLSLAYLIGAGSILGFTAYVWLIAHESPTRVGTYAYVNPVVAVLLGHFAADEPLSLRTVVGGACVLFSIIVITTTRKPAATN